MVDVLPLDFLKEQEPTGFSIRYENEVHYGHQVDSQVVMGDNETKHRVQNGDKTAAEAIIHWASEEEK